MYTIYYACNPIHQTGFSKFSNSLRTSPFSILHYMSLERNCNSDVHKWNLKSHCSIQHSSTTQNYDNEKWDWDGMGWWLFELHELHVAWWCRLDTIIQPTANRTNGHSHHIRHILRSYKALIYKKDENIWLSLEGILFIPKSFRFSSHTSGLSLPKYKRLVIAWGAKGQRKRERERGIKRFERFERSRKRPKENTMTSVGLTAKGRS